MTVYWVLATIVGALLAFLIYWYRHKLGDIGVVLAAAAWGVLAALSVVLRPRRGQDTGPDGQDPLREAAIRQSQAQGERLQKRIEKFKKKVQDAEDPNEHDPGSADEPNSATIYTIDKFRRLRDRSEE